LASNTSLTTPSSSCGELWLFLPSFLPPSSFLVSLTLTVLSINYANEKLQDHFNYATFKSEQDVYIDEGLKWTFVAYPDNSQRLELFEHKTCGLFALTDENLKLPSSSDTKLADAIFKNHLVANSYVSADRVSQRDGKFTVKHFACDVTYSVGGFLDKNRSEVSTLINECMTRSLNDLVNDLSDLEDVSKNESLKLVRGASMTRQKSIARPGTTVTKKTPTVASQFSSQLKDLMAKIKETRSHFIRCIKPNSELKKEIFTVGMVMDQIRCGGALGAVQVLRAGFPNRMEFSSFVSRYSALMWVCGKNQFTNDILKFDSQMSRWSPRLRDPMKDSQMKAGLLVRVIHLAIGMLDRFEGRPAASEGECDGQAILTEGLQMGLTRIFLRANAFEFLERLHLRAKICSATYLQRRWKARQEARRQKVGKGSGGVGGKKRASQTSIETMMYFTELTRSRILREVWATAILQRRGRVFLEWRRLRRAVKAATHVQCVIRGFVARRVVSRLRYSRRFAAAARIQQCARRMVVRKKYLRQVSSVRRLQPVVRGHLARSRVSALRRKKVSFLVHLSVLLLLTFLSVSVSGCLSHPHVLSERSLPHSCGSSCAGGS
jgi:myosin V